MITLNGVIYKIEWFFIINNFKIIVKEKEEVMVGILREIIVVTNESLQETTEIRK